MNRPITCESGERGVETSRVYMLFNEMAKTTLKNIERRKPLDKNMQNRISKRMYMCTHSHIC